VLRCAVPGVCSAPKEIQTMWDIGMIVMGVAFFVIAVLYVKGCELLVKKEPGK
jgi:hypothetical protein